MIWSSNNVINVRVELFNVSVQLAPTDSNHSQDRAFKGQKGLERHVNTQQHCAAYHSIHLWLVRIPTRSSSAFSLHITFTDGWKNSTSYRLKLDAFERMSQCVNKIKLMAFGSLKRVIKQRCTKEEWLQLRSPIDSRCNTRSNPVSAFKPYSFAVGALYLR